MGSKMKIIRMRMLRKIVTLHSSQMRVKKTLTLKQISVQSCPVERPKRCPSLRIESLLSCHTNCSGVGVIQAERNLQEAGSYCMTALRRMMRYFMWEIVQSSYLLVDLTGLILDRLKACGRLWPV